MNRMFRHLWILVVAVAILMPVSASAKDRLTVLFTGDVRGEIDPCG